MYFYLKHNPLSVEQLKHFSERLGVLEYVSYCIFYTNEIFDDSMLLNYFEQLKNERADALLHSFGLSEDERQEWQLTFLERLFITDLNAYFTNHLSAKEMEKIRLNRVYMG